MNSTKNYSTSFQSWSAM